MVTPEFLLVWPVHAEGPEEASGLTHRPLMVGDLLHGHRATQRAKEVSFISCRSDNPHQSLQCPALMTVGLF